MNDSNLEREYAEQNRRDQISHSKLGSILSIILVLFCYAMDRFVYPELASSFLKLRVLSATLVAIAWALSLTVWGQKHYRAFGIVWFAVPLTIILWMIYAADDPQGPYYAGLNIVLLAVGLLSPWTFKQNLITAACVLMGYVFVCLYMASHFDVGALMNNTTFLILTAVIVISGSYASSRQRRREFELRWELERNRKTIEENNRKLVELGETKSRFFANISHELRTPLTLLLAPLESLRERYAQFLGSEGQEMVDMMRDNGMRLLKLINDLLDLVRLEEGRSKIEDAKVELDSLIRGLAANVQHTATTRDVRLVVDVQPGLPLVVLDRDKIEKTVLNLVFNALKFTEPGGEVSLKVVRVDDRLVISVSDTGIGISQENLGQLFQRFWQVDGSARRKQQGAGIGLSLVKEFTEAQGGSVDVESQLGVGTTFNVRLPFVEVSGDESAEVDGASGGGVGEDNDSWLHSLYREAQLSPADNERLAGRTALYARPGDRSSTVLVAEDEPDMLRFIRSQLGSEHRIVSAKNGREAVEKALETLPDVIVLDMMMPEMDGMEACGVLRKDESTAHIPIIMLTARADEDTKLAALAAGANDFIPKPFSVTELHVRVRNLIDSHFSRVELAKQNQTLEDTLEMLRETEMQLLQSEKLASIGELSAGMSHEVKNPLNYALTGIYALRNRATSLPSSERADYEEIVATVEEGVRRVMETVNTLRELVHPQVENRQEFEIQDAVDAALRLLRAEWKGRVNVQVRISPDSILFANKSMILLVLLNLLKNSMDALHEKAHEDGEPTIWVESEESDGKIMLRVRDNGPGISGQNQAKVFDILGMGDFADGPPVEKSGNEARVFKHFFSTKAPGAGMGMGLSICRRIVRAHGGKISFGTETGEMCEFLLEFPVHMAVEKIA